MEPTITLPEILKRFREQRGLSKRALSQKAGLSPAYVGKLEAGEIEPSVRSFLAVVHALELTEKETMFCVRIGMLDLLVSHP